MTSGHRLSEISRFARTFARKGSPHRPGHPHCGSVSSMILLRPVLSSEIFPAVDGKVSSAAG